MGSTILSIAWAMIVIPLTFLGLHPEINITLLLVIIGLTIKIYDKEAKKNMLYLLISVSYITLFSFYNIATGYFFPVDESEYRFDLFFFGAFYYFAIIYWLLIYRKSI